MCKAVPFVVTCSLALSLMLVGCSPTSTSSEGAIVLSGEASSLSGDAVAERVQIRWFVGLGTGTSAAARAAAETFVEAFNGSQDEIELVLEVSPGGGVYGGADLLRPQIEAGHPPDVIGPTGQLGVSLFPGLWLDLEPLLVDDDLSGIDPAVIDAWRVEGRLVGLPTGVDPSVIYYNRDLFDAADLAYPPHRYGEPYADGDAWTIEKLEEIAIRLTVDASGNDATSPEFDPNRIVQWGFHWQWESGRGLAHFFGADSPVDAAGNATIPDHWREAFHWYYDGMWEKRFIPTGGDVDGMQGNSFASGKVAMVRSYLWYLPRLVDVPIDWDMAAIPSYEGTITVDWSSSMVGVLNSTAHPREAVVVAHAVATSPELLAPWGNVPALESLQPGFFEALENRYPDVDLQVAVDSLEHLGYLPHTAIMPNHPAAYARFDGLRDLMSARGDIDIDVEIDKLESDLQAIFIE
jgi:multiple sugar transport system substrate-binding protein